MSGSYLLDTNIVIGLLNDDTRIVESIKNTSAILKVPITVVGELFYGAELSSKKEINRNKIDEFTRSIPVVDCDVNTAKNYAIIKSILKIKGTPIPENDIWIAAIAAQHNMKIVTRDNHFSQIPIISVIAW
ncbi:MAG: type II toxin-antitoxin system VapC family toxin [Cytophagales bacterium]|jgi:tRNA(fMet)-specific endonuclease VapC|nr:type II toxin-antitoxin system VapC family toxin [Cytophagales bacterium]